MRQIRRFELDSERCVALDVARACVVEAEAGQIWLTVENDPTDYWLTFGKPIVLERGQRIWLSAAGTGVRLRVVETGGAAGNAPPVRKSGLPLRLARALWRTLAPVFGPWSANLPPRSR
jgi:hypothetical protein